MPSEIMIYFFGIIFCSANLQNWDGRRNSVSSGTGTEWGHWNIICLTLNLVALAYGIPLKLKYSILLVTTCNPVTVPNDVVTLL